MQNLKERLTKARSAGVTTEQVDELKADRDSLRRHLCCTVCNHNLKQVVLSKCWHLFCRDCIQSRLGARSRKCPTCGVAFAAADVHEVFM